MKARERSAHDLVEAHFNRPIVIRFVRARWHLFLAIVIGVAAAAMTPSGWLLSTRALVGWNVGVLIFLALVFTIAWCEDDEMMHARAAMTQEGALAVLILCIAATAASGVAIVSQLGVAKGGADFSKGGHTTLAVLTIFTSWTFVHTMFALQYSRQFYREWKESPKKDERQRGGLDIPGSDRPDYIDFFYYSFVIGVANQTADIMTTSWTMRRTTLCHCVLAFVFNTAIVALTINIAASLLQN